MIHLPPRVCIWLKQLVLSLSCAVVLAPKLSAEIPDVAKIKAAAEAGSAEAQYAFAQNFGVGSSEWKKWMTSSAAQGYGPAEDEAAWTSNWAEFVAEYSDTKTSVAYLKTKAPQMRQALLHASSAADKGFGRSRLLLACAYAKGRMVTKDGAEAYKWMKLAQTSDAIAETVHKALRQELGKTLPLSEVQEGERRAAQFHAGGTAAQIRSALVIPKLKLAGLASSDGAFVAIVNGTKLVAGRDAQLNIEGMRVAVRCISVDAREAVISLLPGHGRVVLRTGQPAVVVE